MSFYVYIIKSINKKWFYIGLTTSPIERLTQHNKGRVKSTKHNRPYKLVYKKKFSNRFMARDFEKYLKIRSNKEKLLKKIGYFNTAEVVELVDTQS